MKKSLLVGALAAAGMIAAIPSAHAALAGNSVLNFDPGVAGGYYNFILSGSFFAMDTNGNGTFQAGERTGLSQTNGIVLGTAQAVGDIDQTWSFFSNNGNHYTNSAANVTTASGNTASVDFSGWTVFWNNTNINMGSGASNGLASVVCVVDCSVGDTYTLDYLATVPNDGTTNFGNVSYTVHLEGTIAAGQSTVVPVPAAAWLLGSGLMGLVGVARRRKA